MKTTEMLISALHSFRVYLRNHGSFPNTTPRVLLVSTVAEQCCRWHLWHDLIYPRLHRSSNRGERKRRTNGVKREKYVLIHMQDAFLEVLYIFKRRILFTRLRLILMCNDLSYFSHYLRTLLFITFSHALYKHLEINRNKMNFVKR